MKSLNVRLCVPLAALAICSARAESRPNVLFLFADDQSFTAWGGAGNPHIRTPHLDRLAESGMVFTHAHLMGSTRPAVCMPSRAMLLSGRTLFHLERDGRTIPAAHPTLPETLRQAGYATFGTGKWHNDRASYARSFSHGAKIFFGGMWKHEAFPVYDFDPKGMYDNKDKSIADRHSSVLFTDAAINFLEDYDDSAPFFMYVSYMAPHDPRTSPAPYATMHDPEKLPRWPNFMPVHPFDNGELRIRDELLAPFPRTPEIVARHRADYYGIISHLDAQVGRLLDALARTPHGGNTIVVYTADNGLAVGRHGLMGKQNLYEHSVRVPLILRGPGIHRGKRTEALCYLLDLYPTLADFLGVKVPDSVEGRSLRQAITGDEPTRPHLFYAYEREQRGLRRDRFKLLTYLVDGERTTQLFDLDSDPHELKNLADIPEHAELRSELENELARSMKSLDDPCDLALPDWGCQADSDQ